MWWERNLAEWPGSKPCDQCKESSWRSVTSGMHQGPLLEPTVFDVLINERVFPLQISRWHKVHDWLARIMGVKQPWNKLEKWSSRSHVKFSKGLCKVLHLGRKISKSCTGSTLVSPSLFRERQGSSGGSLPYGHKYDRQTAPSGIQMRLKSWDCSTWRREGPG